MCEGKFDEDSDGLLLGLLLGPELGLSLAVTDGKLESSIAVGFVETEGMFEGA